MGRPRLYATEAERKRAYEARNREARNKRPRRGASSQNTAPQPQAPSCESAPEVGNCPKLPRFVAIDGEGVNRRGGRHVYTLLGASDGSLIEDKRGLKTRAVFEYLIGLADRHPGATFVAFGLDYDVNMWLASLQADKLDRLRVYGSTMIPDRLQPGHGWRLHWMPGKWFGLGHGPIDRDRDGAPRLAKGSPYIRVYDVFGFFQAGFAPVVEAWGVATPDELGTLRSMKAQRGDFDRLPPDQIREYNALECRLLADLMTKVSEALARAGIHLSMWHGAGAIASRLLQLHAVKSHNAPPPKDVAPAVMSAYFGGRIQLLRPGRHAPSYSHDLNSAYPWAMSQLPSLRGAWVRRRGLTVDPPPWAVWRVSWELPHDAPVCPFPWRDDEGQIYYPYAGEGWYYTPEVIAACRAFPGAITVHEGYELQPEDAQARPFAWVRDLYASRLAFRAQGDEGAAQVVKYGINSLSGKVAQRPGYHGAGPCQSYVWAGLLTSIVRARLLSLAMSAPYGVIAFATDCVFADRPLADHEDGKPLGGWEVAGADRLLIVQPGVYAYTQGDTTMVRVRGFYSAEVNWAEVGRVWDAAGVFGFVPVTVTRFVSLRGAVSRGKPALWRRWVKERRSLSFYPPRGFALAGDRVLGPDCGGLLSEPYRPGGRDWTEDKWAGWAGELLDQPEGVD